MIFPYVNKIKSNRETKAVAESLISLSLLQICGYVFPLLTFPYLTRVVGVDCFGLLAFASTVISYFQTVIDWGFQFTAVRDIAQHQDDKEQVSRIFSNVMNARILLMSFCIFILLMLIILIPQFRNSAVVLLLTSLLLPGSIIFPDWFFQGIEKMRYITITNFLFKLIFTLLVFVFIKERSDYLLQPVLTAIGYLFSGLLSIYLIIRKWGYKWYWTPLSEITKTIKDGFDIFINTLLPQFYNSFSQILLMTWGGPVACGIYAAADKFNAIMSQLIQVVSRAFFPFLARRIDKHTVYAKVYISTCSIGSFLLFVCAPIIIHVFLTDQFEDSILILRLLAISLIFSAIQNVYGTNYLIVQHYDRILRNINLKASIIGFFISFPLVYFWGCVGAALTVLFTRCILACSIFIKAHRIKITSK